MVTDAFSHKEALGNVIRQLRTELNLSQEKLASEAQVDRTRAGEIERGEANVTIDTLARIANVLGHTLGSLLIQAEATSKKGKPTRSTIS